MNYLRYAQSEILRMLTPVPNLIMREPLSGTYDWRYYYFKGSIGKYKHTFGSAQIKYFL
jgi:hypothetical protein